MSAFNCFRSFPFNMLWCWMTAAEWWREGEGEEGRGGEREGRGRGGGVQSKSFHKQMAARHTEASTKLHKAEEMKLCLAGWRV